MINKECLLINSWIKAHPLENKSSESSVPLYFIFTFPWTALTSCWRTCTEEIFWHREEKQDWFMIIADAFRVFISVPPYKYSYNLPLFSGAAQDLPPTSMNSSSLNASSNPASRDSFIIVMTKNAIVVVLAVTINIVNFALIQTIRRYQVCLFAVLL